MHRSILYIMFDLSFQFWNSLCLLSFHEFNIPYLIMPCHARFSNVPQKTPLVTQSICQLMSQDWHSQLLAFLSWRCGCEKHDNVLGYKLLRPSVVKLTIISSYNGLLHGWHQTIIWTNAGILLITPIRTNFSEKSKSIHFHSRKSVWKCHLENGGPFVSASMC